MHRIRDRCSELVVVALVCLPAWAYGSVEPWAELGLFAGIAVLTALADRSTRTVRSNRALSRLPEVALAGVALLAFVQVLPLPPGLVRFIAPSLAASRAHLLPSQPEQLLGDAKTNVALPATTLSIEPDSTVRVAARLAAAWLLFQTVTNLRGTSGVTLLIARAIVCNATFLAIFAIVQGLTWNGCIYWVRPVAPTASAWSAGGPFVSHNHLAAYLNVGLGLALGLLLPGNWRDFVKRDATTLATAYAAAIIAVGVICSHSRSGFLSLMAACVFSACYLRRRLIRWGFGLAVVLVMMGLCLALMGGSSPFVSRLMTILDLANEGYQSRLEVWRRSLEAWWVSPIWGSGFGAFAVAVAPHLRRPSLGFFARAENEYVDMLVEGGAIGLSLVAAFLAGMGGLVRRAMHGLEGERELGIIGGVAFGLIALSVQSVADFAPHVPAVGVLAVILCGLIARSSRLVVRDREKHANLRARGVPSPELVHSPRRLKNHGSRRPSTRELPAATAKFRSIEAGPLPIGRVGTKLVRFAPAALAIVLVVRAVPDVWIENQLARVGLPLPGTFLATVGTLDTANWGLDGVRHTLESALISRPHWSEGYVRLGLAHLGLYRQSTETWLEDSGIDLEDATLMSDPLWLLKTMHRHSDESIAAAESREWLAADPVSEHLVPAARCFLEARRCSPFLALPHAELAAIDYLLNTGDTSATYMRRALALSGNDTRLLTYLAEIAVRTGEKKLAAECWRKSLEVDGSLWKEIADASDSFLSPEEILNEVVTCGCDAIRFADHLYPSIGDRTPRARFFQVGIDRLEARRGTLTAEQLFLEAHALANVGDPVRAGAQMEKALTLEPSQGAWREEHIGWLLLWGRTEEAHAQALTGSYFAPESQGLREALDRTADALARGATSP